MTLGADSMLRNISIPQLLILLPALIIAFTIHELCHGLMAYVLGDSTAKRDGRLTLNPIRHIDPIGLICILLFQFGWAKPVMVDPRNLKNPKIDMAFIAIAGPVSNFIMAFVTLMCIPLLLRIVPQLPEIVTSAMIQFALINVMLGVFNLLPIPPLDGSKVIGGLLPDDIYERYMSLARFGMPILLILMLTRITGRIIFPVIEAIFDALVTVVVMIYA